jgi:hypothetical protein
MLDFIVLGAFTSLVILLVIVVVISRWIFRIHDLVNRLERIAHLFEVVKAVNTPSKDALCPVCGHTLIDHSNLQSS